MAGMTTALVLPTSPIPLVTNPRRVCVPSDWLVCGLHVVELDRPWHDTPFVVEGFLADRPDELQALRLTCQSVHVDLDRSDPSSAAALLERLNRSNAADAPQRALRPRADVRPGHVARVRFRQLIQQGTGGPLPIGTRWLQRLRIWMQGQGSALQTRQAPSAGDLEIHARRGLLQPGALAVQHAHRGDFMTALSAAMKAVRDAHLAITASLHAADSEHARSLPVEALNEAAYRMADAVIDHPDTLLWCAQIDEDRLSERCAAHASQAVRVAIALLMLGRHMGLDRRSLAELGLVGLMADLGKHRIRRSLLDKPGMLTAEEFEQIQSHVAQSMDMLKGFEDLPVAVELAIAQHHERLDGSGYPRGLKGDAISLFGRMAAIADCYTGLISPRAYAMASSPHEAMTSLCEWAGVSFDGPLVEQFIQAMTAWPAGSLVELDSGEVAVVMTPVRAAGERMLVQVLLNVDKDPLAQPELRRISAQGEGGSPESGRTLLGSLTAGAYGIRLSRWADALLAH